MHFCMLKILAQKYSELTLKKQKVNGICERMSSIWFFPLHKLSLSLHTHDRGTFSPSVAISRKKRSAFLLLPLLFNIVYFFPKQHHCWPLLRAHSGNSSENFHQNNHCFGPELPSIKISCMLPGRWKKWILVLKTYISFSIYFFNTYDPHEHFSTFRS